MQNLEPKNGDFVRYIERLHQKMSSRLQTTLRKRNALLAQRIQEKKRKGASVYSEQSSVRNVTSNTTDRSVLERLWTQWKEKKTRGVESSPTTTIRTRKKQSSVENSFPVLAMFLIAFALNEGTDMINGLTEVTGLPVILIFLAVGLLAIWFKGITRGKR